VAGAGCLNVRVDRAGDRQVGSSRLVLVKAAPLPGAAARPSRRALPREAARRKPGDTPQDAQIRWLTVMRRSVQRNRLPRSQLVPSSRRTRRSRPPVPLSQAIGYADH